MSERPENNPPWLRRLAERTSTPEFRRLAWAVCISTVLSGLAISRLGLWPLEWVMLVPLFWVLPGLSAGSAFRFGWAAGFLAHLVLFRWIIETIVRFSNLPLPIAAFTHVLFAAGHGLLWAVWLALARHLEKNERWPRALALSLAYIVCAAWAPQLFPWWIGMTQHYLRPFAQIADLAGVALVSAVVVGANAALADVARALWQKERPSWRVPAIVGALVVTSFLYGAIRLKTVNAALQESKEVGVALLQPNVSFDVKRNWRDPQERLQEIFELLGEASTTQPGVIVMPESALPFSLWGGPAGHHHLTAYDLTMGLSLAYVVQDLGIPVVASSALSSPEGYYNSALLMVPAEGKTPDQVTPADLIQARYDKIALLTFGETLPFATIFPKLHEWIQGVGEFIPGDRPVTFETGPLRMAGSICYEAILGSLTRRALSEGANVLLNMTNDAWFGEGDEHYQHWTLSLWRTIENRVWLVRVTNNGRTSVVDPTGLEVARAAEEQKLVLQSAVRPIAVDSFYRRAGGWFELLCAVAVVTALVRTSWRLRETGKGTSEEAQA